MKLGQRGQHDITNEMVFKSNPGFIFHDSRGFEAGGATELENVKAFITERSKSEDIKNQVHAIWYCDSERNVHQLIVFYWKVLYSDG